MLVISKGFPSITQLLSLKVSYGCKCSPECTTARHISKGVCYVKDDFLQNTNVSNELIVTDVYTKIPFRHALLQEKHSSSISEV